MSAYSWNILGHTPLSQLTDARLQLHWAAQIVASFGNTLIEQRPDDSQSNLGWEEGLKALCSHPTSEGYRLGLRLSDLTLLFLDHDTHVGAECALSGKTLQQGFQWLTSTISTLGGVTSNNPFALREYDMPAHPVQQTAEFSLHQPDAFQEYSHWYTNAHNVLGTLTKGWTQASPVRCWPHHFDIATLVILDPDTDAEEARSIGCGMSPGDGTYAEPYWYMNIWPYPDKDQLPVLSQGHWHTKGWIGGILTATELLGSGTTESQSSTVRNFFQETAQIGFSLLGKAPN